MSHRRSAVGLTFSRLDPALVPWGNAPASAVTPSLQPPDTSNRVTPGPVDLDVAYSLSSGARIEVYSSVGDLEGGVDLVWGQRVLLSGLVGAEEPVHLRHDLQRVLGS